MKEITNREDINEVVTSFYDIIKSHELLGPIFTSAIPADKWDSHLEKLTDFWDSAVFGSMTFHGNPARAHVKLDAANNHSITQDHFAVWLENWISNLDSNWQGSKAEEMKMRARKMATGLYIGMWHHKPEALKPEV